MIRSVTKAIGALISLLLITALRLYKLLISPLLPSACRFYPSCSCYAREAIEKHGPLRGSTLTARRLLRCRPGCDGGYDPVPEAQVRF